MEIVDTIIQLSKSLFPTGRAFRIPRGGQFDALISALSQSELRAYNDAVSILNSILPDNDNFTTADATDWERRLGLITNEATALADRKAAIIRKMNHPGTIKARQHYLYVQQQLQDAGFNVYVYENIFNINTLVDASSWTDVTPWTFKNTIQFEKSFGVSTATQAQSYQPITLAAGESIILTISVSVSAISGGGVITLLPFASDGTGAVLSVQSFTGSNNFSANGTYTFQVRITASASCTRLYLKLSSSSAGANPVVVQITSFISLTDNFTKSASLVSGITASPFQLGNRQLGQFQLGGGYYPKVVNYIDENSDATFDEGANLRSTFFIGGSPIGTFANVDASRKDEFRQLILKLKPAQTVAYLFINFV